MPGAVHQLRPSPAPEPAAEPRKRIRTKIVFAREALAAVVQDMGALWRLHDRELWPDRTWGPEDPDVDVLRYLRLEHDGKQPGAIQQLHVITARTGKGRLIGYCFEIVSTDPHFRTTSCSVCDLIYLHPDYRAGKSLGLRHQPGIRLLRERERLLDDLKVVRRRIDFKLWRHGRPKTRSFAILMERVLVDLFGYEPEALRFQKISLPMQDEED